MYRICPKCSHVRQENETGDPGVCPACGLIFARYAEAAERPRPAAAQAPEKRGGGFFKIVLLVLVVAGVAFAYRAAHRHPHGGSFDAVALAPAGRAGKMQQLEFTDLFKDGTPLSALAKVGHYTVVEVYLDECAYCRELEAALDPFREKRQDVALIRVHHPGRMNMDVHGSTREEVQNQVDQLNARMKSYHLCGSPHVEVFGPDSKPLAIDQCGDRDGTALLWNWIGSETGIARGSAAGAVSRM